VFLKHSGRNWTKSRLQFLSASFYVPDPPCTLQQLSERQRSVSYGAFMGAIKWELHMQLPDRALGSGA